MIFHLVNFINMLIQWLDLKNKEKIYENKMSGINIEQKSKKYWWFKINYSIQTRTKHG
jgi:hypothetical protein